MTLDPNAALAVLSVLLFAGLLAFFGFLIKHQNDMEPEEKPVEGVELLRQHYAAGDTIEQPTPYYVAPIPSSPDPLESSANLDKKILAGAGMLFVVLGLVGGYLLLLLVGRADASSTTWRDRVASEHQLAASVTRGRNLYANLCFDCHGKEGKGDVGVGLPLNKPEFKYENLKDDPAKLKDTELFLQRTIERGRQKPAPQISMPAWSDHEGGPLNDEQIRQLLALIEFGRDEDWGDIVAVRRESGLAEEPNPPKPVALDPKAAGKALMLNNPQAACVSCHSIEAGKNSPVAQAPNLSDYGVKGPLNAELKALKASGDPDWLFKWVSNAPSIKPGIIMPPFNKSAGGQLDDTNIRNIVEFLQTLGK